MLLYLLHRQRFIDGDEVVMLDVEVEESEVILDRAENDDDSDENEWRHEDGEDGDTIHVELDDVLFQIEREGGPSILREPSGQENGNNDEEGSEYSDEDDEEDDDDEPPHGNGGYYDFPTARPIGSLTERGSRRSRNNRERSAAAPTGSQPVDGHSTPEPFSPSAAVFHQHTLPFSLPGREEMQRRISAGHHENASTLATLRNSGTQPSSARVNNRNLDFTPESLMFHF